MRRGSVPEDSGINPRGGIEPLVEEEKDPAEGRLRRAADSAAANPQGQPPVISRSGRGQPWRIRGRPYVLRPARAVLTQRLNSAQAPTATNAGQGGPDTPSASASAASRQSRG